MKKASRRSFFYLKAVKRKFLNAVEKFKRFNLTNQVVEK